MIAPDDTTFAYIEGRPHAPRAPTGRRRWTPGAQLPHRPGRAVRPDRRDRRRARSVPHVTWGTNPGMVAPVTGRGARPGRARVRGRPARDRAGAALHGPAAAHADPGHHARPGLHRLVHQRPARGPAQRGRGRPRQARCTRTCGRWSCRARPGEGRRRAAKGWTRCSPAPASSGARRAAACAWA